MLIQFPALPTILNIMQFWTFTPNENRLESRDEIAHLTGRASAVLKLLASRPNEVVSQDEILKFVWKNIHVTPDLVREYVFDLRQALGDSAVNPTYIETVRGKGYRLIQGVEFARQKATEPGPTQRARIAVLRPDCMIGGERWQRFADGMADELITDLARFSDIAVIARTSSFAADKSKQITEIAEALRCDYVLESSLSVGRGQLKAQFQLIDGRSGIHVWADCIERPIGSMPELSGEIALSVANLIGGISGAVMRAERRYAVRKPASELDAYENYVLACHFEDFYDQKSMRRGLMHAEQAIELDPEFARGHLLHALFCDKGESISDETSREEWLSKMADSAEAGRRIDSRDSLILSQCARAFASTGRSEEARNVAVRSADMAENDSHAAINAASALTLVAGEYELADQMIKTAYKLCPTPPEFYAFAHGRNLLFSGRASEAEVVASAGPDFESTYVIRCLAQSLQGKVPEAEATWQKLLKKYPYFSFENYPQSMGMVSKSTTDIFDEAVERLNIK
ncbi:winged helix-turn-helix domain-containing protein [uncultured Roseovarius sp.]|uniref:winged helix-turn-helix domain-containing protein n=1 Tax=uncultured Roseovarius sp. TaxID=293344 RepID=UPI00260E08FC|nr:winged helix-turn-helix domain-containing protein [uncultured Roseovarius sp.]